MAMLIQKFHRLIQSRLLWLGFLVIVVFSFVIWGTYVPGQDDAQAEAMSAGELNGEPVPQDEFRHHYFNCYLRLVLSTMQTPQITDALDERLRELAWRRLISFRQAKEMGLTASDGEVVDRIKRDQLFSREGRFSEVLYNAFVQRFLGALRVTETQFEEHVREEIMLQKLRFMVTQAALVPPSEIKRRFSMLRDTFVAEYGVLTAEHVESKVKVDLDSARQYFEANPEPFRVPDQVRVQFAQFDVDDYLDQVTEPTEEEAQIYYEENILDYTLPATSDTNAVEAAQAAAESPADAEEPESAATAQATEQPDEPATDETAETAAEEAASPPAEETASAEEPAPADTAEEPETAEVTETPEAEPAPDTIPFEQVKDEITEKLRRDAARGLAADQATDFVIALTPDRSGKALKFEEALEKFGLKASTLEPFSEDEPLQGIDAGAQFNRAAFGLEPTEDAHFSDAVIGQDAVYVIRLDEKIPSHIPTFEQVQERVFTAARAEALAEALATTAKEIHDDAVKQQAEGKSFAEVLEKHGVEVTRTDPFATSTGLEAGEYTDAILRGILPRNAGEICEPVPAGNSVVLTYVVSREDANPAEFGTVRGQIQDSLRRREASILIEQWEDSLLRAASFVDRQEEAKKAAESEEEEAEGEEVEM